MNPCQRVYKRESNRLCPILMGILVGTPVVAWLICGTMRAGELNRTQTPRSEMFTVEHDGHRFVAFSRGGLLHHPGCPCHE